MSYGKSLIIVCSFVLMPLFSWAEAIIVDDSDNFAVEEQYAETRHAPTKYDESLDNDLENNDESALVHEEQSRAPSALKSNAELIDKIQGLKQEVQELRGQLEIQTHDLKLLQQQQLAFYKDLDARLGTANTTAAASTKKSPTALDIARPTATTLPLGKPVSSASRANPAAEQINYLAAYELIKNKQYDNALQAMQAFVQKYPTSGYTANAEYWLGELFLAKKEYPNALIHFETVLTNYPSSTKVAASLLKTGYAYIATGNVLEAKRRLEQVMKDYPNTRTAQLARSKLASLP